MSARTFFLALCTILLSAWLMGCAASSPERVMPDQGSRMDVDAICAAADQSPDGKLSKQQFCSYFKDQNQAAQTFDALDTKQKGYVTKEDVQTRQENLDHVIRLTGPRGR
jgi:hypothetical protein